MLMPSLVGCESSSDSSDAFGSGASVVSLSVGVSGTSVLSASRFFSASKKLVAAG